MAIYKNTRALGHPTQNSDLGISHGVYRITTMLSDLTIGFRNWTAARKTRRELSRLPDRILDDIGITRAEIADYSVR